MTTTLPQPQRLWLGYFFAAIAVIGGGFLSAFSPLFLSGRYLKGLRRHAARVFRKGCRLLLEVQPWLAADVRIAPVEPGVGTLYVSNHRSTLDVFFLLGHLDGIRILAKRTLLFVPFLREAMWLTRQIFVKQGHPDDYLRAMRQLEQGLRAGESMHVFPEYTRCPPGFPGTQKFAGAPFQMAQLTGARVVPIVFEGTDQAWPKGRYALRYRAPVRVRSLDPIDPLAFPTPKALADEVRARIEQAMGQPA
jgi:1-acyl-sn-glycerol-3-phosphate acyltransferase